MAIRSDEIYNDVQFELNKDGGFFAVPDFNNVAWLASLAWMDWCTGDISGLQPPEPYLTQKNRDWVSDLLVQFPTHVVSGFITKPSNYYLYENLYKLNGVLNADCGCDDEDAEEVCDVPIELLGNVQYKERCGTWIKALKPSFEKPICKMIENKILFNPVDIGSVVLEYYRYPAKPQIASSIDPVTHNEVITSVVDFDFQEIAREFLVWYIVRKFAKRISDQSLLQANGATNKSVRDSKI